MMTSPSIKKLRVGLVTLAIIFILAVLGYCAEGRDLLDAIYMVVITLSTVGYGEHSQLSDSERIFTILVIVIGVSTGFYIIGGFVQMMAEGEINRAMGVRRVSREIKLLAGTWLSVDSDASAVLWPTNCRNATVRSSCWITIPIRSPTHPREDTLP